MTPPARHWHESASGSDDFDPQDEASQDEFYPGERIGHPLESSGGTRWRRWSVVLMIAIGGGWWLLDDHATLPGWPWGPVTWNAQPVEPKAPVLAQSAIAELPPLTQRALTSTGIAPSPGDASASSAPQAPPVAPQPSPDEAAGAAAGSAEPLAPPTVDEADPNQKRAAAVGLHPGVSAVVLKRLSPTDYRNAAMAISKALAEASDTDIFVWPKKTTPELALFQVRFVASSNPDCRRYIVNVTKDGWSTTAQPMETCGDYRFRPKANKAAAE